LCRQFLERLAHLSKIAPTQHTVLEIAQIREIGISLHIPISKSENQMAAEPMIDTDSEAE
jgi:hypothetical protein